MRHTRQLLVMIYALCLAVVMQAQTPVSVTPVTSTEGYDFYATFLPNGSSLIDAADLKLQFLVSSRVENAVAVQYADGSYGENVDVAAGSSQVIEVEAKKAYWDITNDETETKLNKGIRIFSRNGAKMTVYAVNQIGTDKSTFSTDGAHVLPKQALGHEYIVSCNSADVLASEFVVMSTTAGTTVKITLPDKMKTSKGKSELAVTFDKPYQIYIVRSQPADPKDPTISMDLSGTTICADHPVAVWSGNQAARFTTDQPNAAADYAFDQLLPIDRWGTQFIVPMTGLNTRLNKLDIVARDAGTKVKITTSTKPNNPETKELASKEKWSKLIDAYHGQESNFSTLQDSVYIVTADKPIEVHLYTSSSVYNVDRNFKYQGDPSMTMISPVEYLTDTAVFTTFHNPQKDAQQMSYELVVWAKRTTVSKLKLNGIGVNKSFFKNLPGSAFSGYQYARIPIEEGYHLLTADDKGFGGYVCGLEDGQAVLYPVGYDITPVEDSLFLSKKYEPKEVHGGELKNTYPDKANGGGWYLDKVVLPNQPTQYDTIFICDSTKLRFPVLIRNKWNEIKWEVMRINPKNQKRTEYTDDGTARQTGTLSNPFLEAQFFVSPEKKQAAGSRPKYEDFEVRAILYREPVLCGETDINKWQKDTLSTIVRTYRSYNDTTWLIRCTNDSRDIVEKDGKYYIKFFKAPGATEPELTEITVGENMDIPTHKYTTVNGCENDSIVTLRVLLCESDVEVRKPDYLCEDELKGIHSELDGFFPNYDFYEKLQTCKKNKQGDGKWSWNSSQLYWDFTDTDTRRTTDCNPDMERWHNTYGAAYPRGETVGCDRSLTVTLHVLPITEYDSSAVVCKDSYTWTFTVNNDYNPTPRTVVVTRAQYGYGSHDILSPYTPSGKPPRGFDHQCQRELHTLHINFIRPNETSPKTVELCQDGAPLVVNKTSDPDIADDEFEWIFTPKDSVPGEYYSDKIECVNSDNCPYYMQYKITVNKVDVIRDTVVYCYDNGSRVEHKWEGHASFWARDKSKPNEKPKRYNANTPLRIDRPKADKTKDTRVIYELADTIPGNPCHIVYSQTVILLPPYSTSEAGAPISTEQWFEWHNVIWAGEKVDPDTVPSGGKQVVKLQEYGRIVPEGWTVEYIKAKNLYALTTTTTVQQYKRADGSLTYPCDSTVQLAVQVADVQRVPSYAWECSNHTPYEWQAGDTTIYINLTDSFQVIDGQPIGLPKTIHLKEHRKTVDDPKRTVYPWPVAGIDAYFSRDLTIYPAYVTTEDSAACQDPGKTVVFKGKTFSLDKDTTLVAGNELKTQPKYWTKPDAGPDEDSVKVECDSIEGVRLFVLPRYTEAVNKERSTYKHEFYSHDTVSFFTNPRVLFVGKDFFDVHPEISSIEELKRIAKVDSALVIDETLVPELGDEGSRGGIYHGKQISDGTHTLSCDSTTFLDLTIFKTKIIPPIDLGDNGDVLNGGTTDEWKFGGDTTVARADGTRYHTCPLMTGDYFHFYYDANGNVIVDADGNPIEVDYFDPDNKRGNRDYHYSENDDGTRTYLLIDTVLNADGTQDVYVQHVIVYPTYLVDANTSENLGTVEVCASDTYHWEGHNRNIVVSDLPLNNRQARVEDPLCAKRYEDRGICVDSICILELTVFGNANVPQKRHHCFNDTVWKWRNKDSIYYDADAPISGQIRDTIRPHDSDEHNCYDVYTLDVIFDPAYGVAPYKGYNNQYHYTYVDPYISKDTVVCYETDDFRWLLKTGEEHVPSNLYLYTYDGNKNDVPDNRYTDALGNPTNKIPDNKVPTDLPHSDSESKKFYTVRDSLLTVGCFCDSVLTLSYEIIEAMPDTTIEQTICKGESYDFDGETLTEPGKYEKYIQQKGQPCKTWTTLYLTVDEKATTVKVDSALVCFGEADIDATYALRYSYKGNHPKSYSVSYKEDAQSIGFVDIEERPINRPESEWKADSVYVLNLPLPRLDARKDYPTPGEYHASISFKNEVCTGSSLMTYDFKMKVNYPAWVMEQRHNDLIVLLDADYNGGHAWNRFEWFKNGGRLPGYTKPYLYIPEGLLIGNEQTAEYHAVLTETDALGNVISSAPTCPIVVKAGLPNSPTNPDKDHGPSSDYLSVTPTCVPRGGSIHILFLNESSNIEYRITTVDGQFISKGDNHEHIGTSLPASLPAVEGMYIVQVWSSDKESKESYRAIKVIVKDTCPNCDKSSF